jgi:hypothetical protein
MVTSSNNLVFDTERNEKHHADRFWAWALALAGAHNPGDTPGLRQGRVIGRGGSPDIRSATRRRR